ncbi:hypothetical protein KCP71_20445 [Salmonella enterica subsp. enterica]|nr:hypothetical protein KCP71_20445 [Salmonella enterica subsp. enterica]
MSGAATRCSIRQQFAGYHHLYLCAGFVFRAGKKTNYCRVILSGGFRGSGKEVIKVSLMN